MVIRPLLKDKICKKELNFTEKQKCNMCDGVIFIILFSFPLSFRMCVTLRPARIQKVISNKAAPLPKISGIFEYLRGGRMMRTKRFSDYRLIARMSKLTFNSMSSILKSSKFLVSKYSYGKKEDKAFLLKSLVRFAK